MKNWTIQEIKEVAERIETSRNRASNHQNPYNVFTAWKMSENDHTKMFLALMRYQNASGRYRVGGSSGKYLFEETELLLQDAGQ